MKVLKMVTGKVDFIDEVLHKTDGGEDGEDVDGGDDGDDVDGGDDDDDDGDDDADYNVISAGLGHMCPNPQNGLFQCFKSIFISKIF